MFSVRKAARSYCSCQATQRATPGSKNLINDLIALSSPKCQTSPGELTRLEGAAKERQAESFLAV